MIRSLSLYSAGESNSDCKIENRTPIARLRILSTNRYTSRAFYFWDCKDMASFFYFQIFLQFCLELFKEYEKYRHDKADECCQMIPLQSLSFEHQRNYYRKYGKGYYFLDDFQLHERERTAVAVESDSVCRHLGAVFEECHCPRE